MNGFPFGTALLFATVFATQLQGVTPAPTVSVQNRVKAYEAAHPGVFRVGGDVSEPVELSRAKPAYPEAALNKQRTLSPIMVMAVITETGTVVDPQIVSSEHPDLNAAVLEAVRKCRYKPARLHGKAVSAFLTFTFMFAARA